jgi:hypothetical protein
MKFASYFNMASIEIPAIAAAAETILQTHRDISCHYFNEHHLQLRNYWNQDLST